MAAATSGHASSVLVLLDHGADISLLNDQNKNCVWLAASNGHVDALKMLLSHLKNKPERGEILNALAPRADPAAQFQQHLTALMRATISGHVGAVRALLHAKASLDVVSEKDENPLKPLELAAATGNKQLVELLLEHGSFKHAGKQREEVEKAMKRAEEHKQEEVAHLLSRRSTKAALSKQVSDKRSSIIKRASSFSSDNFFDHRNMEEVTKTLTFDKKAAFQGQLVQVWKSDRKFENRCEKG